MFVTIGSLKVDYTGECLLSTDESESEEGSIFSFYCTFVRTFSFLNFCLYIFLINRISFHMNCHYVHLGCVSFSTVIFMLLYQKNHIKTHHYLFEKWISVLSSLSLTLFRMGEGRGKTTPVPVFPL